MTLTTEPGDRPGLRPIAPDVEALARLESWILARATPRTGDEYRRQLRRFLAFRAQHPEAPFLEQVQKWLCEISASQHKVTRAAIRHAFGSRGIEWEEILLRPHRRDEAKLHAGLFGAEARAALRRGLTGPRDRALIECFWTLRRAEVAGLVWSDLDLPRGIVRVCEGAKGGKRTTTLLPASTRDALAAWFVAAGAPSVPTAPVFPNRQGAAKTPCALGEEAKALLKRAGFWKPGAGIAHRFRRSFATEYLRANPSDLEGLRRLLRHENIATTVRYCFLDTEDLSARLERVAL